MKQVRICPKCGSTNVDVAPGDLTGLIPSNYQCYDCGLRIIEMPLIDEDRIEEFRMELKSSEEIK